MEMIHAKLFTNAQELMSPQVLTMKPMMTMAKEITKSMTMDSIRSCAAALNISMTKQTIATRATKPVDDEKSAASVSGNTMNGTSDTFFMAK